MILNAASIRHHGIITPHREAYRHAGGLSGGQSIASYDVHAAEGFTIWPIHMAYRVVRSIDGYEDGFELQPDPKRPISALAATEEYMRVPLDVGGIFALKSTHARLHASQAVTWTDPGFGLNAEDERGCQLVVELSNLGLEPIKFGKGEPMGQMVFIRSEPTAGYDGRYGNQTGPQGAIMGAGA